MRDDSFAFGGSKPPPYGLIFNARKFVCFWTVREAGPYRGSYNSALCILHSALCTLLSALYLNNSLSGWGLGGAQPLATAKASVGLRHLSVSALTTLFLGLLLENS